MDLIITIAAFLFLIGVVITIHEGGHYLMAQVSSIKVLEFSIGFGKKIFSKKLGKDQTLFTIRLLPLGGYVKPLDKSALTDEEWLVLPEEDKKRTGGIVKLYRIQKLFIPFDAICTHFGREVNQSIFLVFS